MIIVPHQDAKKYFHEQSAYTAHIIWTYQELLSFICQKLGIRVATKPIIQYLLLKQASQEKLNDLESNIGFLLKHHPDYNRLKDHAHPNCQWLIKMTAELQKQLTDHKLVHPEYLATYLSNQDGTIPLPCEKTYYSGFWFPSHSQEKLFSNLDIIPWPEKDREVINQNVYLYERNNTEIEAAITWLKKQTGKAAVITITPSDYSPLLDLYANNTSLTTALSLKHSQITEFLLGITAPTASIPSTLIPHLEVNHWYPTGFPIQMLLPKDSSLRTNHRTIQNELSRIQEPLIQSTQSITFSQFQEVITQTLELWRSTHTSHPQLLSLLYALKNALKKISSLQVLNPELSYTQWHQHLSLQLRSQKLPTDTPLPILTPEQAQGCYFEKVWIVGCSEETWSIEKHSPWLALDYMIKYPLDALTTIAKDIIYSQAKTNADGISNHLPKQLLNISKTTTTNQHTTLPHLPLNDWKYQLPDSSKKSASIRIIQDHAICPFKGFASNRLRLEQKHIESIEISPRHFGSIAHHVLEAIYADIKQQSDLDDLKEDMLTQIITRKWLDCIETQALNPHLSQILQSKLKGIILQWIESDKARSDFTIQSLEKRLTCQLNQEFTINMRIDRIDYVDNQPMIIDYKTGFANITDMLDPRLTSAQMPLYALTQKTASTLAYAHLHIEQPKLQSLDLNCSETLKKKQQLRKLPQMSFTELCEHWRDQAINILTAYSQGLAHPDPATPQQCDSCAFAALCRLHDTGMPHETTH